MANLSQKCPFLIREKGNFPKAGSYIVLNALNEKLNLSDPCPLEGKGHFGTNFPSLGSLSENIVVLIFLNYFVLGHESKIWEHNLGQTGTLHGIIFLLIYLIIIRIYQFRLGSKSF